jgi:hypothetical protein
MKDPIGLRCRVSAGVIGAIVVLIATLSPILAAQVATAAVTGVVADGTGRVVPGATVDVRDPETNQRRTLVTDDRGAFRMVDLSPGTYDIEISLDGFAPYVQHGLTLAIGATVPLVNWRRSSPSDLDGRSIPSSGRI